MRSTSSAWRSLIAYSHPIRTVVESWLGATRLYRGVPLTSGSIEYDDTGIVKRRLTMSVPARTPDGRRWDPAGDPAAPLAAYGQRLRVQTGIGYPNAADELMDHGWYLITDWARDEANDSVSVAAVDLAQLVADYRFPTVMTPAPGATYASEFTRLMGGILPVVLDPGVVDRALTSTVAWDRERAKALSDLVAAWPARWYVGDDGKAHVATPYPPVTSGTPVDLAVSDGATGTVTARARSASRSGLFNVIVVDGKTPDDGSAAPHAVAEITGATSPIRAAGPYGRVTRFYTSDLITTQAQADQVAASMLVEFASVGRAEKIEILPDPSIQLGDVVRVYTRDGDAYTARVVSMKVPLTPGDAPMELTPGMLPAGTV